MKQKLIFFLTILIYVLLGFSARIQMPFIEMDSFEDAGERYLPVLIVVSLVVGSLYFLWFRKVFPGGYGMQSVVAKFLLPLLFCSLSYAVNVGWLFTLNTWLPGKAWVQKFVVYHMKSTGRRSQAYRVVLHQPEAPVYQVFIVGKKEYSSIRVGDTILMELWCGAFNIKYATEYAIKDH